MAKKQTYPRYNKVVHCYIEELYRSRIHTLSQCYDSWSPSKQDAYDYCYNECTSNNGYRFRILSSNSWQFTCAYLYDEIDNETGEVLGTKLVRHSMPLKNENSMTHRLEFDVTKYYTVFTEHDHCQFGNFWYPQMEAKR